MVQIFDNSHSIRYMHYLTNLLTTCNQVRNFALKKTRHFNPVCIDMLLTVNRKKVRIDKSRSDSMKSQHLEIVRVNQMTRPIIGSILVVIALISWVVFQASVDDRQTTRENLDKFGAEEVVPHPDKSNSGGQTSPSTTRVEQKDSIEAKPIEIIFEIDDSDPEIRRDAWDSGFEKISEIDPQRILRWRPVRVDPNMLMSIDDKGEFVPLDLLALSIFPNETVVVRRTRHRITPEASTLSWTGIPENGDFGSISVHIVPETNKGDLRAFVHYSNRFQDFHVVPTKDSRYYVAVETNRDFPMLVE